MSRHRLRPGAAWALLTGLAVVGACKDGGVDTGASATDTSDAGAECVDLGYEVTWDSFAESFFSTYCDACHAAASPNRFGAPENVTFDTVAEAQAWEARIRARVLDDQDMPVGGGVYEDDLYLFEVWMDCGLPK